MGGAFSDSDSQLAMFRTMPNETISVTRPGQPIVDVTPVVVATERVGVALRDEVQGVRREVTELRRESETMRRQLEMDRLQRQATG